MASAGVLPPHAKRPPSAYAESVNLGIKKSYGGLFTKYEYAVLRDNFRTSTWVLLGACLQTVLLYYVPGYLCLVPAFVLLGWRIADTMLMTIGIRRNHFMDGVIPGKVTAHFPDAAGKYTSESAGESPVCLILLGIRCNHPLGMFAPKFKTIFDFFNDNIAALEAEPERYGWLGMTGWLQGGDRATGSEQMMVGYFKDADCLHRFAHGVSHRKGWVWWDSIVKDNPHLSLMHETYMVPRKHWETVYINHHLTGLAGTSVPCTKRPSTAGEGGETKSSDNITTWLSPVVEARKGTFRASTEP